MIGKPKAVDSHLHLWRCCITTASHALGVRLGLWKCAAIWREHRCLQLAVLKDFRQASHLTQERCCRAKYFKFSNCCSRASCFGRCVWRSMLHVCTMCLVCPGVSGRHHLVRGLVSWRSCFSCRCQKVLNEEIPGDQIRPIMSSPSSGFGWPSSAKVPTGAGPKPARSKARAALLWLFRSASCRNIWQIICNHCLPFNTGTPDHLTVFVILRDYSLWFLILTCLQTMIWINRKHSEIMIIWSEPSKKKGSCRLLAYCQPSHWKERQRIDWESKSNRKSRPKIEEHIEEETRRRLVMSDRDWTKESLQLEKLDLE